MSSERFVTVMAGSLLAALSVGVIGGYTYKIVKRKKENKEISQVKDSTAYHQSIDTLANSVDTASKKNTYDYSTQDMMNTTVAVDSVLKATEAKKPVLYKGVEVDSLVKFPNAKLIGVDQNNIEFYLRDQTVTCFAKGLLFELNDSILNVIGPDAPFYPGQRYDISYHPFKSGVNVSGEDILKMFYNDKFKAVVGHNYNAEYDGVLVQSELNRRIK